MTDAARLGDRVAAGDEDVELADQLGPSSACARRESGRCGKSRRTQPGRMASGRRSCRLAVRGGRAPRGVSGGNRAWKRLLRAHRDRRGNQGWRRPACPVRAARSARTGSGGGRSAASPDRHGAPCPGSGRDVCWGDAKVHPARPLARAAAPPTPRTAAATGVRGPALARRATSGPTRHQHELVRGLCVDRGGEAMQQPGVGVLQCAAAACRRSRVDLSVAHGSPRHGRSHLLERHRQLVCGSAGRSLCGDQHRRRTRLRAHGSGRSAVLGLLRREATKDGGVDYGPVDAPPGHYTAIISVTAPAAATSPVGAIRVTRRCPSP